MKMKTKRIALTMALCMVLSLPAYAAQTDQNMATDASAPKPITIDEAVQLGLKNNLLLEKVKVKGELSSLTRDNASDTKTRMVDAEQALNRGEGALQNGSADVYGGIDQVNSAQAALESGVAPADIPIRNPEDGTYLFTVPKGQHIAAVLEEHEMSGFYTQVVAAAQAEIDKNRATLNDGLYSLENSSRSYNTQKSKYTASMSYAMSTISSKLGLSVINTLDTEPMADLLDLMARKNNEITQYSYDIYKNQIALLIQNNYYDAIKEEKLLALKEKTVERAKTQAEFAAASYEAGAKAKDDMLMAKSYYDGTMIDYDMQVKAYHNALLELRKNMGVSATLPIGLVEVNVLSAETYDVEQGIVSGAKTRLEVKTADAQKEVYDGLFEAVHDSNFIWQDNEYKEAQLLIKNAEVDCKLSRLNVENAIRQSYETFVAVQSALKNTEELQANAEEALEIAKYKYDAGFGADNALLQSFNLQGMSGTIMEVIAADENLLSIQEKIVELKNGCNLAKAKYLNDIGVFAY